MCARLRLITVIRLLLLISCGVLSGGSAGAPADSGPLIGIGDLDLCATCTQLVFQVHFSSDVEFSVAVHGTAAELLREDREGQPPNYYRMMAIAI
jgi:hypothetical protein